MIWRDPVTEALTPDVSRALNPERLTRPRDPELRYCAWILLLGRARLVRHRLLHPQRDGTGQLVADYAWIGRMGVYVAVGWLLPTSEVELRAFRNASRRLRARAPR